MPLNIALGYASETGRRERNEDFCGIVTPEGEQLDTKGIVTAVADGVGGGGGGREAAEYTVRGLLSDYYGTPETWEIPFALDKVLSAINRWMLAQNSSQRDAGMATTLSLLVLRGCRYFIAHVGDTRIYRLRGVQLRQLTTDHVWDRPGMQHVLKRAVGLDQHLMMDYIDGELLIGDIFLIVSDGVWETLGDHRLSEILAAQADPQVAAQALIKRALACNSQDNVTAVVVKIQSLPEPNRADLFQAGRELPLPGRLKVGQIIDEFEVIELLYESRGSLLYKVRHIASKQVLVLKTLHPSSQNDLQSYEALLAEEWLAKRLLPHYFSQVVPSEGRQFLYYVMTYHEGHSLQRKIDSGHYFPIAEITQTGIRLAKGIAALHRLNIIHRDIKPANVHMGDDGKLRILDLGVALNSGAIHHAGQGNPGTPSFIAPELFNGGTANLQSDLYAIGVTLYYALTRKYPYGEIEPFQHPRFGEPIPPTRYRPDIPQWLENILLKAVTREPKNRFETIEELLLALERGQDRPLPIQPRMPIAERNPVLLWQSIALISFILNALLVYLIFAS